MKQTVLKTDGKTGNIEFDEIMKYVTELLVSDHE